MAGSRSAGCSLDDGKSEMNEIRYKYGVNLHASDKKMCTASAKRMCTRKNPLEEMFVERLQNRGSNMSAHNH